MDSISNVKDIWYFVQPTSQAAADAVFDLTPVVGRILKFSIHWCSSHYDHGPGHYRTPASGMSTEDKEAYGVLIWFVDGFFPVICVTREGHGILDEDGEPMFEARPINTKALVECRSYGEAVNLLGFCLLDFAIFLLLDLTFFYFPVVVDPRISFLFL